MDITQAIRDTENSLRDLINDRLQGTYGAVWESKLGITEARRARWAERLVSEERRSKGAPIEPRLLYYSDFYDLWEILRRNWDVFKEVFGDSKTLEVWMSELERLRDPNAHNRDLLPYQRHLALGISGDIRAQIIRYRKKMDNADDYFPKIESVRDSVGNAWPTANLAASKATVRVGDQIEFVITATDPLGEPMQYGHYWHPSNDEVWEDSNTLTLHVPEHLIGKSRELHLRVRSGRKEKAYGTCDDFKMFHYDILPRKL